MKRFREPWQRVRVIAGTAFSAIMIAGILVQCTNEPAENAPNTVIETGSPPTVIAANPPPIAPSNALVASNETLISVAKFARPAVVNIVSLSSVPSRSAPSHPFFDDPFFRRFFGEEFGRQFEQPQERRRQGVGSGVIVGSNGYIITNNHVVEGAEEIRVLLSDKREFEGVLVGTDPKTDLAVIKVDATDLSAIPWGNSSTLQVGEMVMAIGNPFGLTQTVTMGIISAVGRANVGIVDYEDFIQTDAAINPGNSGGALVNLNGELIGINTAIFSRSGGHMGIGFAIPSRMAKAVMTSLIEHGRVIRGWLGVSIQDLNQTLAEQFKVPDTKGALVADVMAGSPADEAKLKRGDIIRRFGEQGVNDSIHLRTLVAETPPGTSVPLTIVRDGQSQTIAVAIGTMPQDLTALTASGSAKDRHALSDVTVGPIAPGASQDDAGVVVRHVRPGSPAHRSGLRAGDIILEVNRTRITGVDDYERVTRSLPLNKSTLLLLRRGNSTVFMTIPPDR